MRKIAAVAAVLMLAGCGDEEPEIINHKVEYFRDYSTRLCFADVTTIYAGGLRGHDVAAVECTDRVLLSIEYAR